MFRSIKGWEFGCRQFGLCNEMLVLCHVDTNELLSPTLLENTVFRLTWFFQLGAKSWWPLKSYLVTVFHLYPSRKAIHISNHLILLKQYECKLNIDCKCLLVFYLCIWVLKFSIVFPLSDFSWDSNTILSLTETHIITEVIIKIRLFSNLLAHCWDN